jgi:hypothetical protein
MSAVRLVTVCNARVTAAALACPSANTCSWLAVPPFEEVGVPPTVIATYSVPPTE